MIFCGYRWRVARRTLTVAGLAAMMLTGWLPAQESSEPIPAKPAAVEAQPLPEDRGANALWQDLKRLRTWASMMMIVAHPDDEDGGMLTYESRGQGVRTSLLTLTRGEGGQNVMSSDADDALGLIRTNELLKADEYYGVEQYWTQFHWRHHRRSRPAPGFRRDRAGGLHSGRRSGGFS